MYYKVTNSIMMTKLEEFVKELPEKFVETFDEITAHVADSNIITMSANNFYMDSINVIPLDRMEIKFYNSTILDSEQQPKQVTTINITGMYNKKGLTLCFNNCKSFIKEINVKSIAEF